MKFGGTSVGSPENIKKVVAIIKSDANNNSAVVVSAFSGVTDLLLKIAHLAQKGEGQFQETFNELSSRHLKIIDSLFPAKHRGSIPMHLHGPRPAGSPAHAKRMIVLKNLCGQSTVFS